MVEFKYVEYVDDWGDEAWKLETRKKFPSGSTGILYFESMGLLGDGAVRYNVVLDLQRKRKKHSEYRAVTGRDGLEPAGWVLQALQDFEQQTEVDADWPFRIEVMADDDRRWKLYERILTKRGYTVTMVENNRTLVKRIER